MSPVRPNDLVRVLQRAARDTKTSTGAIEVVLVAWEGDEAVAVSAGAQLSGALDPKGVAEHLGGLVERGRVHELELELLGHLGIAHHGSAQHLLAVRVPTEGDVQAWLCALLDEVLPRTQATLAACADLTGMATGVVEYAERLALAEARYRTLVEELPAGVYYRDFADAEDPGWVSPQVRELLGLDTEAFLAEPLRHVHAEDRARVEAHLRTREELKLDADAIEYRVERRDPRVQWIRNESAIVRDAEGAPQFLVGVLHDVSAQREAESRLQADGRLEAVHRLAAGLADDFNNLLTVVQANASELVDGFEPGHRGREGAEMIVQASRRGARLTQHLLAFCHRQPQQLREIDLARFVSRTSKIIRPIMGEDVQVELDLHPVPTVHVDRAQLENVLVALAINAREAMPRGGTLHVGVGPFEVQPGDEGGLEAGPYARLEVRDTGQGMDPETLAHAFEPFFTTKDKTSAGLGLATAYGIARQHHGILRAESEPGHGSSFELLLPTHGVVPRPRPPTESSGAVRAASPAPAVGRGETILVADDNPGVRLVTSKILERAGYAVVEAVNGAEALAWITKSELRPALIVSDVVMPKMGGKELGERVAELGLEVPVLYMSGFPDAEATEAGLLDGPHYLRKPFSRNELLRRVRRLLDAES